MFSRVGFRNTANSKRLQHADSGQEIGCISVVAAIALCAGSQKRPHPRKLLIAEQEIPIRHHKLLFRSFNQNSYELHNHFMDRKPDWVRRSIYEKRQ